MARYQEVCFGTEHSGIHAMYTSRDRELTFSGWYGGFAGVDGGSMELGEFLQSLGITLEDCEAALRGRQANRKASVHSLSDRRAA